MGKGTPRQNQERSEKAAMPEPEATPHVEREHEPESPSRLSGSQEPSENEEKQRVAKKLRERSSE